MWSKTPKEKAEDFAYADDPAFSTIPRKLARWAADNVSVIKELKPPQPPGFNNRLIANWKLPLQIAQHAGGGWPEQDVVLPYTFLALHMSPAWEFSSSRHCGRCLPRTARR
jgi:hypothetical protein